jgi:hypothetical protein
MVFIPQMGAANTAVNAAGGNKQLIRAGRIIHTND